MGDSRNGEGLVMSESAGELYASDAGAGGTLADCVEDRGGSRGY